MAPRTGPRGVTIEDVRRVADQGTDTGDRGGYTFTRRTPGIVGLIPGTTARGMLTQIIGGPSSGYGMKYGGYPTQTQFQQAVIGQAAQAPELAAQMADQAARNRMIEDQAYLDRLNAIYDPYGYYTDRPDNGQNRLEPIVFNADPSPYAGGSPYAKVGGTMLVPADSFRGYGQVPAIAEARSAADEARRQLAANQAIAAGQGQRYEPMRMAMADMQAYIAPRIGQGNLPGTRQGAEMRMGELRQMRNLMSGLEQGPIAANLAATQENEQAAREADARYALATRDETSRRLALATAAGLRAARSTEANTIPLETVSTQLSQVPISSLAQQIATQVYGTPPSLAAGMFTAGTDVNYYNEQAALEKAQLEAQGIDPNASIGEIILNTQGPDALNEYNALRAQAAQEKAYEAISSPELDAYDAEMLNTYGITPQAAAGDMPVDSARQAFSDPNFVTYLSQAQNELQNADATTVEEKRSIARDIAAQYYGQTGDPVKATILLNTLFTFDFLFSVNTGG